MSLFLLCFTSLLTLLEGQYNLSTVSREPWKRMAFSYWSSGMICGYESSTNNIWLIGGDRGHEQDITLFNAKTKQLSTGSDILKNLSFSIYASSQIYVQDSSDNLWFLNQPNGDYLVKYDLANNILNYPIGNNQINITHNQGCLAYVKHSNKEYLMIVSGYIPGGTTSDPRSKHIQLFNIDTLAVISTSWATLQIGRKTPGCVVHPYNNNLYVMGGTYRTVQTLSTDTIEKFDCNERPDFETNAPISAYLSDVLPKKDDDLIAVPYKQYIVISGGSSVPRLLKIINIETEQSYYDSLYPLNYSVDHTATIFVGNTLYLFSGDYGYTNNGYQFQDFNPTLSPTTDPTSDPTHSPTTLQPTLAPTTNSYTTVFIQTNVGSDTMILPDYQNNVIVAITSVVYKYLNVFSLQFLNVLECDGDKYGWQYIVEFSLTDFNTLKLMLETDDAVQNEIEVAIQDLNINNGYDIALDSMMFGYNDVLIASICQITVNTTMAPRDDDNYTKDTQDKMKNFATFSYLVLGTVIIIPLILFVTGIIVHNSKANRGTDRPDYKALFRYFTNLGDFWSDILFAFHLNAVGSNLFLYSAIFTFIPYTFSIILLIGFIYVARTSAKGTSKYINISKYLHKYDYILIGLSLIGGLFPSLSICSSKLFHAKIFSLDFRQDQISKMQIFRFVNITALENLPQLVIQVIFATQGGLQDAVTIIAMFFSLLSLLMGFIRTISVILDRKHSTVKTDDVDTRLGHWLRADTQLNEGSDDDQNELKSNYNKDIKNNIQNNPNILFKMNIKSQNLRKNHLYTKKTLTKLISNHIGVDDNCLELFGFNMINNDNLQFYVEIQLVKLMRFEIDLTNTKFSKLKDKMIDIGSQNDIDNDSFIDNLIKEFKLNGNIKEIGIICEFVHDIKTTQLVSSAHH